jgi:hypothetical protein
MPKRSRITVETETSKSHRPKSDPNQAAFDVLQGVIDSGEANGKNPIAVALGRLGGLKGGRARAVSMTAKQRSESAKMAASVRWKKAKGTA